jgi:putative addiction module CopG family antidote
MPMQVQLTPQIETIVRALIETGEYRDQDEVIAEAILLLDDERQRRDLRATLAVGQAQLDRGDVVFLTTELREEIRREARQMAAEGREPNRDVLP